MNEPRRPSDASRRSESVARRAIVAAGLTGFAIAVAVRADDARDETAADGPRIASFQHPADRGSVDIAEGRATIEIHSTRGIGRVALEAAKGRWPELVTLRILGVDELEDFRATIGDVEIQGSRKQSGQFDRQRIKRVGDRVERTPLGEVAVRVATVEGGMEVVFPKGTFAEATRVELAWIDWLRG